MISPAGVDMNLLIHRIKPIKNCECKTIMLIMDHLLATASDFFMFMKAWMMVQIIKITAA
jgi:hypothetical protein